jgi:hypothetical protein
MRRRFWWQLADKMSDDVNFVWTQLKISDYFKKQPKNMVRLKISKFNRSSGCLSNKESSTVAEKSSESNNVNRNIMCG